MSSCSFRAMAPGCAGCATCARQPELLMRRQCIGLDLVAPRKRGVR